MANIMIDPKVKAKYFRSDFKMEFQPDRTPMMYAYVTKEFMETLDSMLDGGSPLFSNRLIMSGASNVISRVNRVGDMFTMILNQDKCKELKEDGINTVIDNYIGGIISIMETYMSGGTFKPMFTCGMAWVPDIAFGNLVDIGIDYNQKQNKYIAMITKQAYDNYVIKYKTLFKEICKNVMKCKKVVFDDYRQTITIIEPNSGTGPTADKAYAYAMAILFEINGIKNSLGYKKACF